MLGETVLECENLDEDAVHGRNTEAHTQVSANLGEQRQREPFENSRALSCTVQSEHAQRHRFTCQPCTRSTTAPRVGIKHHSFPALAKRASKQCPLCYSAGRERSVMGVSAHS